MITLHLQGVLSKELRPSCEDVDDLPSHHVVLVVGGPEARMSTMKVKEEISLLTRQVDLKVIRNS